MAIADVVASGEGEADDEFDALVAAALPTGFDWDWPFTHDIADDLTILGDAISLVGDNPLVPNSSREAARRVAQVEALATRLDALRARLLSELGESVAWEADGHRSAKAMVKFHANLSVAEATIRQQCVALTCTLPKVGAEWAAGRLGTCQVRTLARAHANPRVRDHMPAAEGWFLEHGLADDHRLFAAMVTNWVRLVDEDGTLTTNERNHRNRKARLTQDSIDLSWRLEAEMAALQGAEVDRILQEFIEAEWQIDWEATVAEWGDDACIDKMPRTPAQRRCDALHRIFRQAVGHGVGEPTAGIDTNIVLDQATWERALARLAGADVEPMDGADAAEQIDNGHRSSTVDGVPVEPVEAAAHSLIGALRRVVLDAASVPIDLGRKRTFTGLSRLAVQLGSSTCYWPGCDVASSSCQLDHLTPYTPRPGPDPNTASLPGGTNPGNGGPACGWHNRWKERGFTVIRNESGGFDIRRPDGSLLERAAR